MFDLFDRVGYALCHQLPERSFSAAGVQVAVCARDTGIYVGFIVSLALLVVMYGRVHPRALPNLRGMLVITALIAFMAWDGVTSYAGLRETTNLLRSVTGVGAGFAMALVSYPLLNDVLWRSSTPMAPLDRAYRIGLWSLGIPATVAAIYVLLLAPWPILPIVVFVAVVATFTAVNLIIVGMLPRYDRRAERVRQLLEPAFMAFLLGVAELAAAGALRHVIESMTGTIG